MATSDPLFDPQPIVPNALQLTLGWRLEAQPTGFLDSLLGREKPVDLDLAVLLTDAQGQVLEQVWFKNVRTANESIRLHGDRVAGQASESIDQPRLEELELIDLDLDRVDDAVRHIWLAVGASNGHVFSDLTAAQCRLRARADVDSEFLQVSLPLLHGCNTVLVGQLVRDPLQLALWTLHRHEVTGMLDSLEDLPVLLHESGLIGAADLSP